MPALRVISFNVHGGVDGWGRPYDLEGVLGRLDADVVLLQEVFTPAGAPLEDLARRLGYVSITAMTAWARLLGPHPAASRRWGPSPRRARHEAAALRLLRSPIEGPLRGRDQQVRGERGGWGIALLSRLELVSHEVVDLGRLPRDRARRKAVSARLRVEGETVVVVGTHMSHLFQGSPLQMRRLRAHLDLSSPTVLGGDMNAWGPVVAALMPGMSRAVRARTWPSWRPHSGIDHLLVSPGITVLASGAAREAGSDHLPVWAQLEVGGRRPVSTPEA